MNENYKEFTGLKIGILTFHRCINYGSYLQAHCLVEGLRAYGHDAVILDHDSKRVNLAEWRCALQPVLPTRIPAADHRLYREKIMAFFQDFNLLPLSPRFQMDSPSEMEHYDVVVVGSDEVWNLSHPWFGRCPLFYGDDIRADRLVSYAASFGNYTPAMGLEHQWAEKLGNFDAVSVRDENSMMLVTKATGMIPELVLDPCLQFPIETSGGINHFNKPYIAVYGHNFSDSFARQIQRFAKQRNLPIISVGYRNAWADVQWITAGPRDFERFMAQSEVVATNFFHGCVFALRNNKPFVCETSPYRTNKLRGLMTKIGGEEHLVFEDTLPHVYDTYLNEPLDPSILQKIESLRQSSALYLNRALSQKQLQRA